MDAIERGEPVGAPKHSSGLVSRFGVYISFMIVGNGCGWFVPNSIWQVLANEPAITQDGRMFGKVTIIVGAVGLSVAFFYLLSLAKGAMQLRTGQILSVVLIGATVVDFVLLACFWDVGAPEYPMFIFATVLGALIAQATYFILFPLVATFYGGWLIAPVRAGTDVSSLVTSLLAEAQNPTGTKNLFPMWVLFVVYTLLATCGLVAWIAILKFGIGLRNGCLIDEPGQHREEENPGHPQKGLQPQSQQQQQQDERGQQDSRAEGQPPRGEEQRQPENEVDQGRPHEAEIEEQGLSADGARKAMGQPTFLDTVKTWASELACPKSLIAPILCATLSQVLQFALVGTVAQIGANMTDPDGCGGDKGKEAYRIALTLSSILVPVGSILSSYGECPRWAFYALSALQLAATIGVVMAVAGVGQEMWFGSAGRALYIACVAVVAGTEGYLLTMAYRYIGDGKNLPLQVRLSASSLLSFLSVIVVNPASIAIGVLVDSSVITCTD